MKGGTSTAIFESDTNIEVIACINHDKNAILSHATNYPNCLHFTEDIREIGLQPLSDLVNKLRSENQYCKVAIWASLECTNFSNAKGGQSRDADSRSLADHLFRYLNFINPDFLWIENVREFMSWGPLDKNNKPVSIRKGEDYVRWVNQVKEYGFSFDYKLLNSADFGAFTSRTRYFAQFAKDSQLISWANQTHFKKKESGTKWKAVKEVLDLEDEGTSIFARKKSLSEATLERCYAGLVKFVANGDDSFINSYYSGGAQILSIDDPSRTLTTVNHNAIVKCLFLSSYYGNGTLVGSKSPCGTLTTKDRFAKIEAHFIDNQYGKSKPTSIEQPIGTITTNPKQSIISAEPFLINANSSTSPAKNIDSPCPTVTQRTHTLIKPWLMDTSFNNVGTGLDQPAPVILANRKYHYILNPAWFNKQALSVDNPSPTLVARQDKSPLSIVSTETGNYAIVVYEDDSPNTEKIKRFMAAYGIVDIKMRMLKVGEMLRIQGFPSWYKLVGTQTEQKKYIGNSVEVTVGKCMFQAIDYKIQNVLCQRA